MHLQNGRDTGEYVTSKNLHVRSKSELIIAERLDQSGIPYRYVYPLNLEKQSGGSCVVHPDFMILNVRERKEIIYEHFGMMDDEEYIENVLLKLTEYELNGYYPGGRAGIYSFIHRCSAG